MRSAAITWLRGVTNDGCQDQRRPPDAAASGAHDDSTHRRHGREAVDPG